LAVVNPCCGLIEADLTAELGNSHRGARAGLRSAGVVLSEFSVLHDW
jgi:hypothetical protein